MKILTICITLVACLTGCGGNYDYSGTYLLAEGGACDSGKEGREFLSIGINPDDDSTYIARFDSIFKGRGDLPLLSTPAKVSKNGSIKFSFKTQDRIGYLPGNQYIDMDLILSKRDDVTVYLESLFISYQQPNKSELNGSFDMIRDKEFTVMGIKEKNGMHDLASENGLCLSKSGA